MLNCGVYKLTFGNGQFYIGSSSRIKQRWAEHESALYHRKHCNRIMQHAYNKHGSPVKEILFLCPFEWLLTLEQRALDTYKPTMNIADKADRPPSRKGATLTQTQKDYLSALNNGRILAPRTAEHCAAISAAKQVAKYQTSEATKEKLRQASIAAGCKPPSAVGRRLSAKHIASIAEKNRIHGRGRVQSAETRAKRKLTWDRKRGLLQ